MSEAPREASASGSAGDVGVRDSMRSWRQLFSGLGLTFRWGFKNGPEEFRVSGSRVGVSRRMEAASLY